MIVFLFPAVALNKVLASIMLTCDDDDADDDERMSRVNGKKEKKVPFLFYQFSLTRFCFIQFLSFFCIFLLLLLACAALFAFPLRQHSSKKIVKREMKKWKFRVGSEKANQLESYTHHTLFLCWFHSDFFLYDTYWAWILQKYFDSFFYFFG